MTRTDRLDPRATRVPSSCFHLVCIILLAKIAWAQSERCRPGRACVRAVRLNWFGCGRPQVAAAHQSNTAGRGGRQGQASQGGAVLRDMIRRRSSMMPPTTNPVDFAAETARNVRACTHARAPVYSRPLPPSSSCPDTQSSAIEKKGVSQDGVCPFVTELFVRKHTARTNRAARPPARI